MSTRLDNLKRLFAPRSVAVVGASPAEEKAGHQALRALATFRGDVYPVHPSAREILGYPCYPSLRAIGRPVDLVLFAIPAAACVAAVEEAIACGCGGGVVFSGGFAETGDAGAEAQARLQALCERSGFRLLGPNTAGFYNKRIDLAACFAPGIDHIRRGNVAVVAQSGGVNLITSFLIDRLGYGAAFGVGLGNAVDIDAADVLEFLADDADTRAIALHLEGVRAGRKLYETLVRVTPRKPVAVFPVGRHDVGEFARSHTGNLIGSYALKAAALRQAGAVVVESTEELAAAAVALSLARIPPRAQPGIGVLVGQAGAGLIVLDRLKAAGVSVPPLAAETVARIGQLLPPMTFVRNPVDTGRPGPTFPDVLAALAADEQIDAVAMFAINEPAAVRPEEVLPAARRTIAKPIVFGTMGPEARVRPTVEALRAHGILAMESPERLAHAAIALARDAAAQWRLARAAPPTNAHAVSQHTPLPAKPDEHAAKTLLEAYGIATPRRAACSSIDEAREAFRTLAKPVVVKILSAEIAHKTEAGGVVLNVSDEAALEAALVRLDEIPLAGARRYLIEEMAPPGLELIVGAVRDASFGPTVMVGIGGTAAEAIKDTAMRLAPVSAAEAQEMLGELRAAALLDGWRGAPPADREALADAIVRLGQLLCEHPRIKEIEINPLRVYPRGVLALDALIV
ncbi:MAG TPA: acetate--CoA ligase family protein [Burkholderiales bacterium]